MADENIRPHYLGEEGRAYTAVVQSDPHHIGCRLNLDYFRPYLKRTDIVLDFGCGNGGMLRLLRECVARADGLEVNASSAKLAAESGCTIWPRIDAMPAEPMYDAIVSNHVLEHVRDVCGTLEQLRVRLKLGGLFLTKLPIDDHAAAYQRRWERNDRNHHLQTWSPRLFANTLFESGYDVLECRVITSAWNPRLFPLLKVGLGSLAFWALAVLKRRRQLFAVGVRPG